MNKKEKEKLIHSGLKIDDRRGLLQQEWQHSPAKIKDISWWMNRHLIMRCAESYRALLQWRRSERCRHSNRYVCSGLSLPHVDKWCMITGGVNTRTELWNLIQWRATYSIWSSLGSILFCFLKITMFSASAANKFVFHQTHMMDVSQYSHTWWQGFHVKYFCQLEIPPFFPNVPSSIHSWRSH